MRIYAMTSSFMWLMWRHCNNLTHARCHRDKYWSCSHSHSFDKSPTGRHNRNHLPEHRHCFHTHENTDIFGHYLRFAPTAIQCDVSQSLFSSNSRKTPRSSPVRARYGVSIVSKRSGWSFMIVIVALRALLSYIWPRYIESWQYNESINHALHWLNNF